MIPQEAVEAVHAAICEESLADHLDPDWKGRCMKAVEAAAPFIRAQALEDAADEGWAHILDLARRKQMVPGADDFRDWLRARAATERGQG